MTITIAHRGEPVRHVENTLAAISAAIAAGADMVEIDVRLTADGVPVLLHDEALLRIWNDPRALSSVTLAELFELVHVAGQRVPTLLQAAELADAAGVELMVDLPAPDAGPVAHDALVAAALLESALFAGETRPLRAHSAEARIALTWDQFESPDDQLLDDLRPEYFNPYYQLLTAATADRMHDRGIKVSVWTVDHPRDMSAVITQGADAVITNRIADLVALTARSKRSEAT